VSDKTLLERWYESEEYRAAAAYDAACATAAAYDAAYAAYVAARAKWMAEHREDDAACEAPSSAGGEGDA
jgi:hypothetical protein